VIVIGRDPAPVGPVEKFPVRIIGSAMQRVPPRNGTSARPFVEYTSTPNWFGIASW
jgi:hypothetical protein